jgi:hypothetical protein
MDFSKFSLDYIRPSDIEKRSPVEQSDPWSEAIEFYGNPVLEILQDEGRKTVDELYGIIKAKVNVPNLEFEQFSGVLQRMVSDGRLSITKVGDTFRDYIVTLPVERARR